MLLKLRSCHTKNDKKIFPENPLVQNSVDHTEIPPSPWTEWQTGVKTLPSRNFVADGNYPWTFISLESVNVLTITIEHWNSPFRSTRLNIQCYRSAHLETLSWETWSSSLVFVSRWSSRSHGTLVDPASPLLAYVHCDASYSAVNQ